MSARAKNKFCRNCKFKTSVNGLYRYLEHKIFLELLTGRDVNEMFDEYNKYKED